MKKTPLLNKIIVLTGLLIGSFALSVVAGGTWTAPTAAPPNGNVDAPINVGGGAARLLFPAKYLWQPLLTDRGAGAGQPQQEIYRLLQVRIWILENI